MMAVNMKSNTQHLLQYPHQCHQISSFNLSCCLRPPPPPPFINHGTEVEQDRRTPPPPIGCMGRIRRIGSYNGRTTSSKKPSQFRRMISSLSSSAKSSAMAMLSPRVSCAEVEDRRQRLRGVSIADTMDLPLPVPKRRVVVRDGDQVCSLWSRRRGRDGLQRLEIARVKLQHAHHLRRSLSGMNQNLEVQA